VRLPEWKIYSHSSWKQHTTGLNVLEEVGAEFFNLGKHLTQFPTERYWKSWMTFKLTIYFYNGFITTSLKEATSGGEWFLI